MGRGFKVFIWRKVIRKHKERLYRFMIQERVDFLQPYMGVGYMGVVVEIVCKRLNASPLSAIMTVGEVEMKGPAIGITRGGAWHHV